MRFFYCDSGLVSNLGHHAYSCRMLTGEARRRGIETKVFAARNADEAVQREFTAQPHFRVSPYWRSDGDPICGWLSAFAVSVQATMEDFAALSGDLQATDLLFVNSGQAAQLQALASWMARASSWDAASIALATEDAVHRIDALAAQASIGAERWSQLHGASRCFDALLHLTGTRL